MHIEIGPKIKLAAFDTLVVMTDGLSDNLHADEIIDRARKGPIFTAAQNLATKARARMDQPSENSPSKPDDLTFLLFRPRMPKR